MDSFANRVTYFWYKLPNQIQNSNRVKKFKIELDEFKNVSKKKNSSGHFGGLSDELL